ncbi:VWA domain-containing protein [Parachlamydia sp. AcF125]|uniref:VWA domain-containing protein n=1 Tax=Parachlamydia sp. AcF125 TaxID=2795736 RepID=UPI001BC9104D|nr:VWA domain-containing protein [Parachlamydia sp. AcF125]MBS4169068.1 hypothetical protein [Parachlamydia sp. AcF125]
MIKDILFDFPEAVFLLPGVFIFILASIALQRHRLSVMKRYSKVLQKVMLPRDLLSVWVKGTLVCLAWVAAVLALMQPKGNSHYAPHTALSTASEGLPLHQMQFILDSSASMQVKDMRNQSRFEYGKEIIDELARELEGKSGSLWAFAGQATRLSPATMDVLFLRLMVRAMQMNEGNTVGTNLLNAVKAIQQEMEGLSQDQKLIAILLSDGEDTEDRGEEEKTKDLKTLLGELKAQFKERLRIYTIGIGTKEGGEIPDLLIQGNKIHSKREDRWLKQIGEAVGETLLAEQQSSIAIAQEILKKIKKEDLKEWIKKPSQNTIQEASQTLVYTLYFQYPLSFALLFLAIEICFPMVRQQRKGGPQ